ncbi:hypothetical protein TNCV_2144041 [Trichonephila clavipes]|nr:hypothetical protein TNCV_2144041 [Trichonephila clavipes]
MVSDVRHQMAPPSLTQQTWFRAAGPNQPFFTSRSVRRAVATDRALSSFEFFARNIYSPHMAELHSEAPPTPAELIALSPPRMP